MKGVFLMIQVTATEIKTNFGKYLLLSQQDDIYITKNGENIAVLSSIDDSDSWIDKLTGVISSPIHDEKAIKGERAVQKYESLN